jgi:hypothetical protein
MSDRETIITAVQRVERRLHRNRFRQGFCRALALSLVVPLALGIYGLFVPLSSWTFVVVFGIWCLTLAACAANLVRRKGSLAQAAEDLDKRLALRNELGTALWFIENPKESDWVDRQIHRAAQKLRDFDPDRLYPAHVPSYFYGAAAMLLAGAALNFVPFSQNTQPAIEASSERKALTHDDPSSIGPVSVGDEDLRTIQTLQAGAGWQAPLPDGRISSIGLPPGNEPTGLEPGGDPVPDPPRFGPPTTLEVQLRLEMLSGQYNDAKRKDDPKGSEQKHSDLDYGKVPSDLRPAQKDALTRDPIPRAYRSVMKSYFEAIRAAE